MKYSTIESNAAIATGSVGGGVYVGGGAYIGLSTISGNRSYFAGGISISSRYPSPSPGL